MEVYVTPDRRWRVEVQPGGRCVIWHDGARVRGNVASIEAAATWLAEQGVEELVRD